MKRAILLFLLLLCCSCGSKKKELHIFTWPLYLDSELIHAFEEKYDCRVVLDSFDSNETLYAKLKSGATGYDLITPTWYYVQVLQKQGMIEEIDHSLIPRRAFLDRHALRPLGENALSHCFPLTISYQGIGYLRDRVNPPPTSWTIFENPKYAKRITLLNDIREVLGAALMVLGYNPNSTVAEEIEEAGELAIHWRNNIAKFDSEQYKSGIATGEFVVVQCNSGELLQVSEENPQISFVYPEEGALISYDMLCIPKGAKEPDLAHAFINFLYTPEISAGFMQRVYECIPNEAAYSLLEPVFRANSAIFPSDETWERLQVLEDLGPALRTYARVWTRVKEG